MWYVYLGGLLLVLACIIVLVAIVWLCYLRCKRYWEDRRAGESEPLLPDRNIPRSSVLYRPEELTPEETPLGSPMPTETQGECPMPTETRGECPTPTETRGESPMPTETQGESPTPTETQGESPKLPETTTRESPVPMETETITMKSETSQPSSRRSSIEVLETTA